MSYVSDSSTKAMALQSGEVDLTENVATISDLQNLIDSSDYNVDVAAGLRCGFSYINQNGVLGNDDLRKAVLMAIDDDTICETIVGGMYTAGCSVVPSHLDYGYDQLTDATPYDVDAAKKLLDDAGIVDSDGDGYRELNGDGNNIELTYYTYDNRALKELAEASATCIEKIGIKCNLQTTDSDTEWNYLVAGEYDLLATNWTTAEIGDPWTYLDNWYSKSSANYCGYKNEEFDKIYEEMANETDTEKRKESFVKLQQILIDDGAALVHGYYNSNMDSSTSITGATTHTADYYWITTDIKPAQ
jgi:peptide/nickel transport system substrate-binding protein